MEMLSVYAPGHYDPYDSYGLIACQLVRHLTGLGVYVNALGHGHRELESQPEDVRAVTAQPIRPTFGGIFLGYPTGYAAHGVLPSLGPRVAVTMFESTIIPPAWVEPLNACHAVVVPARFNVEVFRAAGVTVPIHVVPLGVGEVYRPRRLRGQGDTLTVLAFLDRGKRKGGIHALRAFLGAFGEDPAYRLILKGRDPKVGLELGNANMTVIQRDMTNVELCDLYAQADVLLNPNMGEGFGLIPREFAATGGIALSTAWGGTADDIDAWGVPLAYDLVQADWQGVKSLVGLDLGQWAMPDLDAMVATLRDVAANRQMYAARAWAQAPQVSQMYRWSEFAARVYEIWKGVAYGDSDRLQPAA